MSKETIRTWREANYDRYTTKQREYRQRNKERISAREREYRFQKSYGLTAEQVDALMKHGCAICGEPAKNIDHDHATGAVRGALCWPCNVSLGHFGDDPERLRAAAAYLEGVQCQA